MELNQIPGPCLVLSCRNLRLSLWLFLGLQCLTCVHLPLLHQVRWGLASLQEQAERLGLGWCDTVGQQMAPVLVPPFTWFLAIMSAPCRISILMIL